jgi:hypothetical protein
MREVVVLQILKTLQHEDSLHFSEEAQGRTLQEFTNKASY